MLKVDLRKPYNSVEWPLLKVVLEELGFPPTFIALTSVSYSILINGLPSPLFFAKKD